MKTGILHRSACCKNQLSKSFLKWSRAVSLSLWVILVVNRRLVSIHVRCCCLFVCVLLIHRKTHRSTCWWYNIGFQRKRNLWVMATCRFVPIKTQTEHHITPEWSLLELSACPNSHYFLSLPHHSRSLAIVPLNNLIQSIQ